MKKQVPGIEPDYKSLYKLGSAAAWIAAGLMLSDVIVLALYPPPSTIREWFLLFESNKIIGLLDFWALEIPMYVMFVIVFLAFYVALRQANHGLMFIALTFALLGTGIFLATNNPFSMLALSNQYMAVTEDIQRSAILAAGQTLLINTNQRAVGGFNMGLFLVSVAGLIVSGVMLQSNSWSHSFSKSTAYVGLLANGLSLLDYFRQVLTASIVVALLVILPNALLLIAWYVLTGRSLYRLGRLE